MFESASIRVYTFWTSEISAQVHMLKGGHLSSMATTTAVNVQPLGDRVVVKPLPQEEKTKGGILLPDTVKEKPVQGEILAIGSGRVLEDGKKIPLEVKVGDKVLYGKYSGSEIKLEGEEFVILHENEILGILR